MGTVSHSLTTLLLTKPIPIYTNYIWVAAISEGVPMGEYSDRTSGVTLHTLNSELSNIKECDFLDNIMCGWVLLWIRSIL